MNTTVKQVRNILANELGLTKQLVEEQVEKAISRRLQQLPLTKIIEDEVGRVLNRMVTGPLRHDNTTIRQLVTRAAEQQIRDKLVVSIKEPSA